MAQSNRAPRYYAAFAVVNGRGECAGPALAPTGSRGGSGWGEHAALGLDTEAGPRLRPLGGLADERATHRSALGRVVVLDPLRRASGEERDGSEGRAHELVESHDGPQTFLKR